MRATRRKPKQPILATALVLSLGLAALSSCNLERFRHEKYACNHPRLDIYDIIVRHAKAGSEVKITGSKSDRTAIITSASDRLLIVETDDLALQINRKSGQVTAQKRNKYYSLTCSQSVFTL